MITRKRMGLAIFIALGLVGAAAPAQSSGEAGLIKDINPGAASAIPNIS